MESKTVFPKGYKCESCTCTYYTSECPNEICKQHRYKNSPDSSSIIEQF